MNVIEISQLSDEGLEEIKGCTLTYGHFSTIHPGHIRYLKHARDLGNRLIVAVIGDNGNEEYAFCSQERAEAVDLLGIADKVLILEGNELNQVLDKVEPSAIVLGSEYREKDYMKGLVKKLKTNGCKIYYHAGEINVTSAELFTNSEEKLIGKRIKDFKEACRRHNITREVLIESVRQLRGTKMIVIGDTIVDHYVACEALGMSAEAPVLVVKEVEGKEFIGGAAVVASHIKALGAECRLISVVGNDKTAKKVKDELKSQEINDSLITDNTRPTTYKKRYLVENQKLFRVSRLEDHKIDEEVENEIIEELNKVAEVSDGIIVSDFVYGVITERILHEIKKLASKYNLKLFGDVQCSSQVGLITKFKGYTLLSPNEKEARLALQDKDMSIEQISQNLIKQTSAEYLIMKLGAEGYITYYRDNECEIRSQAFPALCINPLDVAGAGDSLLAVVSTGLAAGIDMLTISAVGCCMTAAAVEKLGNTPVEKNKLITKINNCYDIKKSQGDIEDWTRL
ncbi:MAG: ADP-heptose synthase [Pelagibacteraceae bacterium TMED65]|nr:MAG: ADP-heptose synthase [Pelagibacteraceae bacterium TMED65]